MGKQDTYAHHYSPLPAPPALKLVETKGVIGSCYGSKEEEALTLGTAHPFPARLVIFLKGKPDLPRLSASGIPALPRRSLLLLA